MGVFRVSGCGRAQGAAVRMAWSQTYPDRKGVMGAEHYCLNFAVCLRWMPASIAGIWMPCAVDGSDKRCGDIACGPFRLYPECASSAPFADAVTFGGVPIESPPLP
ncbi:hypothetical protein pneo_cds_937 [Pandoravirus neocaledonia]|nr:hypothetical protein pneo_cds_937 [Pandoravirus neocaledonia]AVK76544.1 hypothetical protein pneo_cds_937 [Pandoravirus neocaledonia]